MVTTRAHDDDQGTTGDKRAASPTAAEDKKPSPGKKAKVEKRVRKKDEGEGGEDGGEAEEEQPSKGKGAEKKAGEKQADEEEEKDESKPPAEQGKGDETKKNGGGGGRQARSADTKPDGMDEDKREEEPGGPEVEGNAKPGELVAGTKDVAEDEGERKHGVIERGHVYMLYRPKVETNDPESIDDVSKFHILLVPDGHTKKSQKLHRLLAIGKKHMPDAAFGGRPLWGQVVNVGYDMKAFKEGLGPSTYETKTRGTRHQFGARVAGSGAYVLHTTENPPEGSSNAGAVYHTHLAYELAVPHEIGEVQEALGIHSDGVFTIQVKNPDSESTNPVVGNQPESKHPQFPPTLKHLFTTKFIPANPPSLLDYPGAELLFIPSKHSTAQAIGEDAKKELDEEEKEVEKSVEEQGEGKESEAKKALKEVGLEGLIEGKALEGHWE
ncbi:hypothetical protein JCM8097_005424 [Rhodosporidiobolus ruineniae]